MALLSIVFVLLVLCIVIVSAENALNYTSIRIDCGGFTDFTDQFNQNWLSDRFYSGGAPALVSEPDTFVHLQQRSLRFFPVTLGKKNCYTVDVPSGRYLIRMFVVYNNYDHKDHPPSFDISVEGTVVMNWRSPWPEDISREGVYSDLYAFIDDGVATICFYSIATDSPIIASLEILQVDPLCYDPVTTGDRVLLVNYGRLSGGNAPFGAGITNDTDLAGRTWDSDDGFSFSSATKVVLTTNESIHNANIPPNYFPTRLYQSAHTLELPSNLEYLLNVDSSLDYMIWFHFAEIDPGVNAPGQRVFTILLNDQIVFPNVDVFKEAGKFSALDLNYIMKNLSGSAINITLSPIIGPPLLSGIESYAILHMELETDSTEVLAMQALKKSLQIPDRMGWNGDPCAPYEWDTWEGVSCNLRSDNKAFVITRLNLAGEGLKGVISDQIPLLTHLISLNLSDNLLQGSIPSGLGNGNLQTIDLSFNQLTGNVPDSLGASQLVQVYLNDNQLDGQVPLPLYSIGVHGGYVNISSNTNLCGVPSLPLCPYLAGKPSLSDGAKVGVAIAVLAGAALVVVLLYIYISRRRKDDYNFGLPHELAATAKHNRYQRHKAKLDSDESNPAFKVAPAGPYPHPL
ncbi:hypothetical protein O6H91_10G064700 [Diphasiastrum complanatum]|uniref:Uncharacterized protein n=1 Tax=Diphasiastrum complanatum TaxID=34168 RepID=A0ACC2CHW3_DIPCM|nr:hypothetical protein O6H91_10G064700 [Diphasiastrum complanatum]